MKILAVAVKPNGLSYESGFISKAHGELVMLAFAPEVELQVLGGGIGLPGTFL